MSRCSAPQAAEPQHTEVRQIPATVTAFVGRAAECAQIVERLRAPGCRLLTITGAGGIGKTRLAIEALRQLQATNAELFTDGVVFVSLASLPPHEQHADLIATAIASAAGVALAGAEPPLTQVAQYLHEKALLLALDNCEHLRAQIGVAGTLLEAAPELTILATSRERLGLPGEQVIELAGLPTPTGGQQLPLAELQRYPAIQLFVQLAQAGDQQFALNETTAPDVAQICRLVDGIPLGIELAAAWVRVLSCREIAAEIAQSHDFLIDANQHRPARQQSLRAVFDYSWALLGPSEQQALRQLAIFPASFTREAAGAVLSIQATSTQAGGALVGRLEMLTLLAGLVDKSLIRRVAGAGDPSYEVLGPVRQYAAEQLAHAGEAAMVARRHAAFYITQLVHLTPDLRGAEQRRALTEIESMIDHVRAAWHWAVSHADSPLLGQAAASLFHFYDMRSWFREGAEAFGAASAALAGSTTIADQLVYGRVLARHAWFMFYLGRQTEARRRLEQSLALLRQLGAQAEQIFALNYLGAVCSYLGDYDATQAHCSEALALAERLADQHGAAIACNILGQAAFDTRAYAEARRWHQRSLATEQATGNQWSMAFSLTNLGRVAYALGEYAEARELFAQALATREAFGDIRGVAHCLDQLGNSALALGDTQEAGRRYAQSLALFRQIGNQWGMAASLINLGGLAYGQQRVVAASRLLHEALTLAVQMQSKPQIARILRMFTPILRQYGETAWIEQLAQLTENADPFIDLRAPAEALLGWAWEGADRLLSHLPTLEQAIDEAQRPTHQPAPLPPTDSIASLTQREIEVLRLVAQGLTDAQVAERLVVSRRTVSTHLTSIYGKLQINSRSAATRFAIEHGLA